MPPVPRIARVVPTGNVTRPSSAIPVIARLRWANGDDTDVLAVVVGWTAEAVEIRWDVYGNLEFRTDWVAAADVRRTTAEPMGAKPPPPSSRGSRLRQSGQRYSSETPP